MKRFGLLIAACLLCTTASGQLYKDVDTLDYLLKNPFHLELDFEKVEDPSSVILELDGGTYSGSNLKRYGKYLISGFTPSDTVLIKYGAQEDIIYGTDSILVRNFPSFYDYYYKNRLPVIVLPNKADTSFYSWNENDSLILTLKEGDFEDLKIFSKETDSGKTNYEIQDSILIWKGGHPWFLLKADSMVEFSVEYFLSDLELHDTLEKIQFKLSVNEALTFMFNKWDGKLYIKNFSIPFTDYSRYFELFVLFESGWGRPWLSRSFEYSDFGDFFEERPKNNHSQLISILAMHSSFSDLSNYNRSEENKLIQDFSANPYLSSSLKPIISFRVREFFTENHYTEVEDKLIYKQLNGYQWQKVVYQGEKFSLDTDFSYQDVINRYLKASKIDALKKLDRIIATTNPADRRGQIDVNTFIAGLSDFIVKKAQEEFNITFLEGFINRIQSDSLELKIFFENTLSSLQYFDLIDYKVMLERSRPAFFEDLDHLPKNISKLLRTPKYQEKLKYSPEVFNLALVYQIADLIYQDIPIDDILLASHKQLKERTRFLEQEINQILGENNTAEEFEKFKALSNDYCDSLKTIKSRIERIERSILNQYQDLETLPQYDILLTDYIGKIRSSNKKLTKGGYSRAIEFDDYYKSFIYNNLNGRNYFGFSNRFRIDSYEDLFGEGTSDSVILIAAGIDLSRNMLNEDYPSFLEQQLGDLAQLNKFGFKHQREKENRPVKNAKKVLSDKEIRTKIQLFQDVLKADTLSDVDLAALNFLFKERIYFENELEMWGTFESSMFGDGDGELDFINNEIESVIKKLETRVSQKNPEQTAKEIKKGIAPVKIDKAINKIEEEILAQKAQIISDLRGQQDSLIKYLNTELDLKYCRDLTRARNNAQALTKAIEYCLHFLHAFDFEQEEKMFFKQKIRLKDSVEVTYTLEEDNRKGSQVFKKLELKEKVIEVFSRHSLDKWLDRKKFEEIMIDESKKDIFLGLLYQRLNAVAGEDRFSKEALELLTFSFADLIFDLRETRKDLLVKKYYDNRLDKRDYYRLLRTTISMINTLVATPGILSLPDERQDSTIMVMPELSEQALSLYENIYARNYELAVGNTAQLLTTLMSATTSAADRTRLTKGIIKYGTFIAKVANAGRAEEVEAALRAVTLPGGSSRIKRTKKRNLSINSYLAPFAGIEYLNNQNPSYTIGLSVPLGFAYSFKLKPEHKQSYTIFGSLLDIGAITSFRFGNREVSALPEFLSIGNYFAPGIFMHYNFKSSTSLTLGGQYRPQAFKIDDNGTEVFDRGFRVILKYAFDVPLFNLHTKEFEE